MNATNIAILLAIVFGISSIILGVISIVQAHRLKDFRRITAVVMKAVKEGIEKAIENHQSKSLKDESPSYERLLGKVEQIQQLAKEWLEVHWKDKEVK